MSEQKEYPIELLPFLTNSQRYSLELVPRLDLNAPVYVQATPNPNIPGYQFDKEEDSKFNLSLVLGNDNGSFAWGRAVFEAGAKNLEIEIRDREGPNDTWIPERILVAELQDATGAFKQAEINLDQHLDIVEYVDPTSREVLRKLGEKPPLSRRSLVLCFDGTSNHFSKYNTNVVKLVELLKKNDPAKQVVYYQTGVGTYAPPGFMTNTGLSVAAKADEAMAWFLYQHVIDGYKYLMQTYQDGDQISIFGFSRGAYTARALAGMIHSVGLLPKHNIENAPFAYQVYEASTEGQSNTSTDDVSEKKSALPENVNPEDFKRTFCIPVKINFVGVWDTVGSVGALRRKVLPWIEYNPSIHYFRQALALDENRGNFIPSVWDHKRTDVNYQHALEVWFKGGHADIGGGAHPEATSPSEPTSNPLLSNITLRWMVRQCLDLETGILFDTDAMRRYRKAGIIEQRLPNEDNTQRQMRVDDLDAFDIISRPYLALNESVAWKILECLPVPKLDQLATTRSQPGTVRMPNVGAPRCINFQDASDPIYIHSSVVNFLKTKLAKEREYVPAAMWHGYDKGDWPQVDEGLSSIIGEDDEDAEVRKRLKMSWMTPDSQGSWLNPLSWSRRGKAELVA